MVYEIISYTQFFCSILRSYSRPTIEIIGGLLFINDHGLKVLDITKKVSNPSSTGCMKIQR